MESNKLNAVDHQQSYLPLKVVREHDVDISDALILKKCKDFRAAIRFCVDNAPVDESVICAELEIDPGHWTRIKKGDAHFPDHKMMDLIDICGNEIPLRWLALSRGYGLVRLKSQVEMELEASKVREAEKDKEIEIMRGLITGQVNGK